MEEKYIYIVMQETDGTFIPRAVEVGNNVPMSVAISQMKKDFGEYVYLSSNEAKEAADRLNVGGN